MNIVANNYMLRYFKKISIFKVDLGFNLKGPVKTRPTGDEPTIKIKDDFIKKYEHLTGILLMKYGEIGRLKFYEDKGVGINEVHIYDGDKIYEIGVTSDDMEKEPGMYLTEILQMIENGGVQESDVDIIKDFSYDNVPEGIEKPDIRLPRDQYIEALINRRALLEKTK